MTTVGDQVTLVVLTQSSTSASSQCPDVPLATRRLCGVPLVRRHLQIAAAHDWRNAIVVTTAAGRRAVAEAVGDALSLGVRVRYTEASRGAFPARELLESPKPWFLMLEGTYVIEGALLDALRATESDAILCDSQAQVGRYLGIEQRQGRVVAWGEQTDRPTHAYAGAVLLSRATLQEFAADAVCSWPGLLSHLPRLKAVDVHAEELYVPEVRRRVHPFWSMVETPDDEEQCKRALVTGAQKHTLDVVASFINRPLESALTLRIADWSITPNQVTLLTSALAYAVVGLMLAGLLLPASLLTFVVNVLDGVDGKLARVKALSSRLGQLEHSLDLLYEQSWYIAFVLATYMRHSSLTILILGFVMLLFDSLARHVSMQFRQAMGVSLADYAPFDRAFRLFDGRRNIYALHMLLGIVAGRPSYAVCTMTAHAFLTALVYSVRAARHLHDADLGRAVHT